MTDDDLLKIMREVVKMLDDIRDLLKKSKENKASIVQVVRDMEYDEEVHPTCDYKGPKGTLE